MEVDPLTGQPIGPAPAGVATADGPATMGGPEQMAGPPDPAEQAALLGMLIGEETRRMHAQIDAQAQAMAAQMADILMQAAAAGAMGPDQVTMPPAMG